MIKICFSYYRLFVVAAIICLVIGITSVHAQTPVHSGKLAIANKSTGELTILNLKDHKRQTFSLGGYLPHETAVAQNFAFVSNYGSAYIRSSALDNKPGNTLSVIDLAQPKKPAKTIDLGPGRCAPHGLAVSPDQKRLYITCEVRQEILVMDVATQQVVDVLPTNQAGSHLLVLNSDESKAFVGNFFHGTITVLDLNKRKIMAQIPVTKGSEGIGISPDDNYIYVTSPIANELIKIDTSTQKEVARKFLGASCGSVRVVPTPDTGRELVINCGDKDTVLVVNAETLEIEKEVKVGRQPIGIAVADSIYAFSANMNDNTVSVINLETKAVEETLPAGELPDGMYYFNDLE
jgi:YVTN family beta-propeller protein